MYLCYFYLGLICKFVVDANSYNKHINDNNENDNVTCHVAEIIMYFIVAIGIDVQILIRKLEYRILISWADSLKRNIIFIIC